MNVAVAQVYIATGGQSCLLVSLRARTTPLHALWEAFMKLSVVKAHEELLSSGDLVEFERTHGHAVFVSHQWLADEHPDPAGQQLKVLQDALRNMLSGKSQIVVPPVVELFAGRVSPPAASELRAKPLFIWYDYFSCPQSCADRQASAIRSINSYVARSAYFMVLCPALKHQHPGELCSSSEFHLMIS